MQTYQGPIFDGDSHIYEQADAWSRYLPDKYRECLHVHHVEEDGKYPLYVGPWKIPPGEDAMRLIDGKVKIPAPGMLHTWLKRLNEGGAEMDWVDIPREAIYRDARIQWMDANQVDACTMFPGEMNTIPAFVEDRQGLLELITSYNRWLGEEWGFNYRDRIYSTAMLSFEDKDWARREIDVLLKSGLRTVALPPGPFQNRSPADPYFDDLWAPLNEAGVVVQYHIGEAKYMHTLQALWGDMQASKSRVGQTAWMWLNAYGEPVMWHVLSSYLYLNFFKRFPNIRIVSSENGAEFVPYFLRRLDKMRGMARKGYWPCGQLDERPSKIFMRHVKVVAFPEDDLRQLIDATGSADWIMAASDYPHTEGVPAPNMFFRDQDGQFSDAEIRKIMHENGRAVLGRRD